LDWQWCNGVKTDWEGKRVIILGGARQGQAAARWMTRHGARVTLNDYRPPEEMFAAQSALSDISVTWVLGSHPIDILDKADVVCLSGGVPLNNPIVIEAVRRGIQLTNDTQVFMEIVPCRTIGITGSAGKTTTTSLVGQMAKSVHGKKTFVGGNIGDPLLNYVDEMQPDNLAILEISSFQLEQMTISPNVAAVLNVTPNHLDRHVSMEAYTTAKQRILDFQTSADSAILCREDPGSWNLRSKTKGCMISYGFSQVSGVEEGSFLAGGILSLRAHGQDIPMIHRDQIQLRGEHNLLNVLAAFAIGYATGLPQDAMQKTAGKFRGIAHRLEFVREWNGAKWYNDSIATAPERTMAAIRSFSEPIILLLGGRDKNLPWEELATLIHQRVDSVILFGEAVGKISPVLEKAHGPRQGHVEQCKGLKEAVLAAARITRPGDVVLLSPGGTSFDQFRDFEERGEAFRKWVAELS
jgi:UDP-N-acetylmuramoylalanine--D-glutamate ligase